MSERAQMAYFTCDLWVVADTDPEGVVYHKTTRPRRTDAIKAYDCFGGTYAPERRRGEIKAVRVRMIHDA